MDEELTLDIPFPLPVLDDELPNGGENVGRRVGRGRLGRLVGLTKKNSERELTRL